jgi:hypothetical protein
MFLNSSDETRRRKVSMDHVIMGENESCIYLQNQYAFFHETNSHQKCRSSAHIYYSLTSSWVLSKDRPTKNWGYMQPLRRQCDHVRTPPLCAFLTGEENGMRSVGRPVQSMRANEIDSSLIRSRSLVLTCIRTIYESLTTCSLLAGTLPHEKAHQSNRPSCDFISTHLPFNNAQR